MPASPEWLPAWVARALGVPRDARERMVAVSVLKLVSIDANEDAMPAAAAAWLCHAVSLRADGHSIQEIMDDLKPADTPDVLAVLAPGRDLRGRDPAAVVARLLPVLLRRLDGAVPRFEPEYDNLPDATVKDRYTTMADANHVHGHIDE